MKWVNRYSLLTFFPYYNENIKEIISILISILVSILSAVLVVYFTFYKYQDLERKDFFYALYDEIIENRDRLNTFSEKTDELKKKWIGGECPVWLSKEPQTGFTSKYFWRYLSLDTYPILISRGYHIDIEGFKKGGIFTRLGNYYSKCHQFCDKIQKLESIGNRIVWSINRKNIENYCQSAPDSSGNISSCIPPEEFIAKSEMGGLDNEIEQVISEMNKIKDTFLNEYNKDLADILTNSQDNFTKSILTPKKHEHSTLNRFLCSNCSYYALISTSIFLFAVYSLQKTHKQFLSDFMIFVWNYYLWILLMITAFVIIAFLWSHNAKDCHYK